MVAVFDTAFHARLPPEAATYAVPPDLSTRHRIRRYGFHGIAHASLAEGYADCTGSSLTGRRLITLQLGNGCSIAAIRNGRSVDTSMGFTPLEGLVMGTRSGDLDPAIVAFLIKREGVPADEVERWLNERSGLLGLSALSRDMSVLLQEEAKGHAGARLAIELFCYRARKYIGAYLAVLAGADAVIFGGGIGEAAPAIRARICNGMEWCGLILDPQRNRSGIGLDPGRAIALSPAGASLPAYVVAVDEETFIARETAKVLMNEK
jgi:acetate kinase